MWYLLRLLRCPVVILCCHAGLQVLGSFNIQLLHLGSQFWNVLVAQLLSPAQQVHMYFVLLP